MTVPTSGLDEFDEAILLMRIVFGGLFFWHGYAKLTSRERTDKIARMFESYGLRPGLAHVYSAAIGLMICGLCVMLGLFTAVASAGMMALMIVAWWTVRRGRKVLAVEGGWELTLVYATVGGLVALLGPGSLSLDAAFGLIAHGSRVLLLSAAAGVLGAVLFISLFCRPAGRSTVLDGR
jgi:putative oxidoreductase